MSLTPQFLDELRARVSLSGVISRTTRLIRAGHEFKACCPFHNEKSPSFTVNDDKGFYHCFGCGAHGDVIRWMTDQRGLSFIDAVKELAGEAGLEMPAPDPRAVQKAEQQAGLHDVMAAAQAFFMAQLEAPGGAAARAYLATRGFDAHTVQRFGFGYAPEDRQALKAALGQFPEAMLIEAGLRIVVDGRDPYDRFRGRLMLPIHDARGRVIAFGGRILAKDKTDAPKYLNSPDTPLFDKGRTLYNLHRAGPVARRDGRLVVVEGYMDTIALAAAGFEAAVAPLGTAMTETQLGLIWRLADVPVLCFDGDAAGQRAAMRAVARALPLLAPGRSLRIAHLPEKLDPDDLLRRDGPQAMARLLDGAASLLETLWANEFAAAPLATPEDKAGLKARLLAHAETIADSDIKSLYRRELLDRFSAFAFPRRDRAPPATRAPFRPNGKRGNWPEPVSRLPDGSLASRRLGQPDTLRRTLLSALFEGLLRWPEEIRRHAEKLTVLASADPRYAALLDCLDCGAPLETEHLRTILRQQGIEAARTGVGSLPPYPFLQGKVEAELAAHSLADAVNLAIDRPSLSAAVKRSAETFDADPEGSIEMQKRLRERKLAFDAGIGQTANASIIIEPGAAPANPVRDE